MRPRAALATVLLALVALGPPAGCRRKGPRAASRPDVIALVGERPVEYEELETYVRKAAREDPKTVSPRVASSLLDQYIEELLLDMAVEAARPASEGAALEERRRAVIGQRAGVDRISEEDLRAEYAAQPERWKRPAAVRLSQLLLFEKVRAEEAVRRLRTGSPWLDVSRELSAAPNAATGGSLGVLLRTDLPREFEKVVWTLPEGALSPIVPASQGFHIFRMEERLAEKDVSFEEAVPALRLTLAEQRTTQAVADLIREARTANPVHVVEEHLPFPYVGEMPHGRAGP